MRFGRVHSLVPGEGRNGAFAPGWCETPGRFRTRTRSRRPCSAKSPRRFSGPALEGSLKYRLLGKSQHEGNFWQGNAEYASGDFKGAIEAYQRMLQLAPNHLRVPEAKLAIGNCQIELKDTKAARKTLEDLIKAYPKSEAAQAGKERLASLK